MAALFTVTYAIANPFAAFGVFLPVLAEHFGWSRGAISLAMSMNLILGGVLGFGVGAIADRHGPRVPLTVTVLFAGAGFALASTVQALWHLYLFVGFIAGIGLSGFYVVATATVSRWFTTGRGLAIGLVLTGFNFGFMTGGPIAALLIERAGWRTAWVVLGASCCLVGGLASLAVRFPPGTVRVTGESRAAGLVSVLGDRRLPPLALSWFLTGFVLVMLTVHIVPFARDEGIRLDAAALAITAYGVGAVFGRVVGGTAADRLGATSIMLTCCALQVVALLPLLFSPSPTTLLAALALFGVGFAGADTAFTRAVPEVVGFHALGAVFGVLGLGWRAGSALGPVVAGFVHDVTGSYLIPFASAPVAVIASFVLFVVAARASARR